MKTQHSIGPWQNERGIIISPERYVAKVYDWSNTEPVGAQYQDIQDTLKAEHEANARLIAAAPELLTISMAYRNLLKTMAHTEGELATFHHIESVIARVKGETL